MFKQNKKVTKNKAVLEYEKSKLDQFSSWYSPDIVTYLAYLNKQCNSFQYIFADQKFKEQIATIIKLDYYLGNKGFCFVSKEPGAGNNHFIFGMIKDKDLLIVNPIGTTKHKDFYQELAKIAEELSLNVYISNNVLQQDKGGLVSCGPICVELIRYVSTISKKDKQVFLSKFKDTKQSEKEGLEYKEIDIKDILPKSLSNLLDTDNSKKYQEKILKIRKTHLKILIEDSLIANLDLKVQNNFPDENCIRHC